MVKYIKNNLFLLVTFIFITFFFFFQLGNSMFNSDAHFWYERTQKFITAVKEGNFSETYQNPKPGITVMWMSGITLETFLNLYEKKFHFRPFIYTYETFPYIHFMVKLPLVLLTLTFLTSYYILVAKLTNKTLAHRALIILAFQPFYVGVARYFHADGTLVVFMTLSVLCLIYFLEKNIKLPLLIVSGVFAGLAFLTKMQAFFVFAFTPCVFFIDWVFTKKPMMLYVKYGFYWYLGAIITFFVLFPALWVNPIEVITHMGTEAFLVVESGKNGGDGSSIVYFRSIPMILNFVGLVSFILGLVAFLYTRAYKIKGKTNTLIVCGLMFTFLYFCQMLMVYQKSERYLLPLFPFISIVGAYGIGELFKRFSHINERYFDYGLLTISIVLMLWNAPHYTAASEIAPWGAVYVDAANYLNDKPNATDLKVIAVPKEHTFRPFFKGKTFGKEETLPNNWNVDYIVAANSSYIPKKYEYCHFEKAIKFRFKTYWEIYKCK